MKKYIVAAVLFTGMAAFVLTRYSLGLDHLTYDDEMLARMGL